MIKKKYDFELKVSNSLGFHFLLYMTILLNQLNCFRGQHWRPWWSTSVIILQWNHLQLESYSSEVHWREVENKYICNAEIKIHLWVWENKNENEISFDKNKISFDETKFRFIKTKFRFLKRNFVSNKILFSNKISFWRNEISFLKTKFCFKTKFCLKRNFVRKNEILFG